MKMPDHDVIYQEQASMYDRLISKQKSVIPFLEKIHSGKGADIVDIGAGTGRLTVPLAKVARSIVALDESAGMLAVTAEKLKAEGLDHWQVQVADHRRLPVEDDQADLVVAGWSICYLASSNHPTWRKNLSQIIGEIRRVLKPGGTVVIFETMGTATEEPDPPDFLRRYYRALEEEYGFSHSVIRTDYTFRDLDEAEELTRFFFGGEVADKVRKNGWVQVPEWAGVWWRSW
jgi:ubiquinone/menaquinone biosynthesis C-methylase UbiE